MEIKFYKNKNTGVITMNYTANNNPDLEELKANSTDAAGEKHVPVVTVNGNQVHVEVGSVLHPMTEAHHIDFICLVTTAKVELKKLEPTGTPIAEFVLQDGEEVIQAYEYCNLHGLWTNK